MKSSLPPSVLAQLEATFRAEAADRLREMQAANEAEGDLEDQLSLLFRHAHSLKGAAAAVGRTDVAELAHDFETRLQAAQSTPGQLDREGVRAMLDDLGHAIDPQEDLEASASRLVESAPNERSSPPASSRTSEPTDVEANAVSGAEGETPVEMPAGQREGAGPADDVVRVSSTGLDRIAANVGDLALTADEWRRLAARAGSLAKRLGTATKSSADGAEQQIVSELSALARSIREQTRRSDRLVDAVGRQLQTVRMEPVDALLDTVAREARRLARQLEHPVDVVVEGSDVQADRRIIGRLRDPLLHLVRNAVDHGAETVQARRQGGKPDALSLRITASTMGASLVVTVGDDGRGIDLDVLRRQAVGRGIDASHLDDDGIRGLIFTPGFSTAESVTDVSGRGVGLAAVRQEIESLYGSVRVDSEPGVGSVFRVEVPQGISGVRCLVVGVADRCLAVPVSGVLTIRAFKDVAPSRVAGRWVMVFDGVARPLVAGHSLVDGASAGDARYGVVIVHAGRTCVLAVDRLVAQLDLIVKPLPSILGDVEGVSGAAMLGDGTLVPILLPSALVDLRAGATTPTDDGVAEESVAPPRLLVVDDSATTRTLIRTILIAAGFEVETAADGSEGLRQLRAGGHDLVVSDIEMPGLDGFAFTRAIRSEPTLAALPVVLVSSRADADDRAESAAAGADVHLDKGAFDQGQLVSVIRELLG